MEQHLKGPSKFLSDRLSLSLGSALGWGQELLSLLGLSGPCWLMPLSPVPVGAPASPEGVQGDLPAKERGPENLGEPCPEGRSVQTRKQSSAGFDYEDLQPGVSFLGNIVCCLYEPQLHSIWYLGRQQARAEMVKCSITPRSTPPLVINIDVH